jgi:serine/threonine protein kinase
MFDSQHPASLRIELSGDMTITLHICAYKPLCSLDRNDLWALGCTLYQMLSGSSPFKDASEWLIFQRIIARDLKFPEYFSDEARDLIDKLLVCADKYLLCGSCAHGSIELVMATVNDVGQRSRIS